MRKWQPFENYGQNANIASQARYLKYSLLTIEDKKTLNMDKIWHNWHKWMKSFLFALSNHKLYLQIDSKQPYWYWKSITCIFCSMGPVRPPPILNRVKKSCVDMIGLAFKIRALTDKVCRPRSRQSENRLSMSRFLLNFEIYIY